MASEVRILRLIEVTYPSLESFEEDSAGWFMPMQGIKILGDKTYRSATINPSMLFNERPENKGKLPGDPDYIYPPPEL